MAAPTVTITFTPPSTTTDVTHYVRSYTINRGRASIFDDYQTGTATVVLDNRTRIFDSLYSSGPHFGKLVPGRTIQIKVAATSLFVGTIENWSLGYDANGDSIAYARCVDNLAWLAQTWFATALTTTRQAAGARISAILALPEVAYPGATSIGTGAWEFLPADDIDAGRNVLDYLRLVERSDWGRLFINRSGTLVYRDRRTLIGATSAATFADDGSGFEYRGVDRVSAAEILRNYITVERADGIAQTVSDSTSIAAYGGKPRTLDLRDLLLDKDNHAYILADYLLQILKDPTDSFKSVSVEVNSLSAANRAIVLGLDMTSVVTVKHTPNRVGSQLSQVRVIEGVSHAHDVHGLHEVTFAVAEINEVSNPFTLGTSALGGPDILAF